MARKRSQFRTRRTRKQKVRRKVVRSVVFALVLAVLITAFLYIVRLPFFSIIHIEVTGGETIGHSDIRAIVEDELSGTYALIIPRHFTYLYPEEKIVGRINEWPRVRYVSVERTSRKSIKVDFSEYTPNGLWCNQVENSTSSPASCLFLDENGYAFDHAPALSGGALIRFVINSADPVLDKTVFDQTELDLMKDFKDALAREHGMRVLSVEKTTDADLVFRVAGGMKILITQQSALQEVFDNLDSILKSEEFEGLTPEEYDYIDLRFGNSIYVKEKIEEVEESTGEEKESDPEEEVLVEFGE